MDIKHLDNLMVVNIFQKCTTRANELGAINLAQGVPEPLLENNINDILNTTLKTTQWRYANPKGLDELRFALSNEYNNSFTMDEILITSGCTESLYLGLYAASKLHGNKVAFLEPFYPYYSGLAELLDLNAVPIAMQKINDQFTPDWNKIEDLLKSQAIKILIINTPHNPSGWVINSIEAQRLRQLTDKYAVFLIIDEAYRYYTYTSIKANEAVDILYQNNENVLLVGSASKLFSATGLRVGWMLGRNNILSIAYALHLYTTYCHPTPLQQVTATLFNNREQNWFYNIKNHYMAKRDYLVKLLNQFGFKCPAVNSGHFLLADYSKIKNNMNSEEFADYFAVKYNIMSLPVTPFYQKHNIPTQVRFSFSVNMDILQKADTQLNTITN